MTATATRPRDRATPIAGESFRTWTPAPAPQTTREIALLMLARDAYNRDPGASTVNVTAESLGAMFDQIDRLEAERDRLGDQGIDLRGRLRRAEAQLTTTLARYAPVIAWCARRLKCEASLKAIIAAIAKAGGK